MNLYHWHSDALKDYSAGDIIVAAESIEEARQKARDQIDAYLKDYYSWWWMGEETIPDEDSLEDYNKWKEVFEADLAKDPALISSHVMFIRGSE